MTAHERVTAAIAAASDDGRTALVPFITAGYPEPKDFISTLQAVAAVGDVVEIGIPFSDPMADGMTIQRSSFEALRCLHSAMTSSPDARSKRVFVLSSCRTCRSRKAKTFAMHLRPRESA